VDFMRGGGSYRRSSIRRATQDVIGIAIVAREDFSGVVF